MKIIEIVTPSENLSTVESIIDQHDSEVLWINTDDDGKKMIRVLVSVFTYIVIWVLSLAILMVIILLRRGLITF